MDPACIVAFRSDAADIHIVGERLSVALFAGIPFLPCTSGRFGAFMALELRNDLLGLVTYLVQGGRDRHVFTLELEVRNPGNYPSRLAEGASSQRRNLLLSHGLLLEEHVAAAIIQIEGLSTE